MAFDIVNILFTLGFIAFLVLAITKGVIHYAILKPLIEHKLRETVEEDDPDFDWNKYINWK